MARRREFAFVSAAAILLLAPLALGADSGASSSSNPPAPSSASSAQPSAQLKATQARQSPISTAASLVGALGSLVPGLITNVAPLVVLFGLGALMMPALGMGAMGLLRESRRR